MARTLELEAQSQLDKGYPNAALSTLQGRPLAALLPELEEALGEVLEAAAKLCPSDKETKPAGRPLGHCLQTQTRHRQTGHLL